MVARHRRRTAQRSPRESTKGMRMCVGCRRSFPRHELLRFVSNSEGSLFVDLFMKAPGRGAYGCYSPRCLEAGVRTRGFSRALKTSLAKISVDELCEQIIEGIDARLMDLLCLARRAGCVRSGMDALERVRARVVVWILALDAAKGSKNSVERWAGQGEAPLYIFGTQDQLGRTQSAPQRVSLGLMPHPVTERIKVELGRRSQVLVAGPDEKSIADANAWERESKAKVRE